MATGRGRVIMEDRTLGGGFALLPRVLMEDKDLTLGAKYAWAMLYWYAWREEDYPGHREAAESFGVGESSLRRYLAELERRGFIEVTRPGLGQTNSYFLPTLNLSDQGAQMERSRRSNQADHLTNTILDTIETNTKQPPLSSQSSTNDKTALIATISFEIAPKESQQAIQSYLGRFPIALITRAAEITRANSQVNNPIAYLYGVIQRLQEQEATQPAAHQHVEVTPELTEEEYQASLQALERVKAQLSQ